MMCKWLKSFNVGTLEINAWDDGDIEIDTGEFSQAVLDREQILRLIDILNDLLYGIEEDDD